MLLPISLLIYVLRALASRPRFCQLWCIVLHRGAFPPFAPIIFALNPGFLPSCPE
ncbi:hypothetical protein BGX38DRAFT_1221063 [Terfezia claveryi]|nr:hypothetical protein BGX38DRAFT_1221063 [Terfezia claveryi]